MTTGRINQITTETEVFFGLKLKESTDFSSCSDGYHGVILGQNSWRGSEIPPLI